MLGFARLAFVTFALAARAAECAPADALPDAVAPADPAALAEAYFDEAERFDALLTYEAHRGPASVVFSVARRVREGEAELLFDVREPASFAKWALLLHQNRGASDDLFAYFGEATGRRIRRLTAGDLERQAFFALLALADYRPHARGELRYEGARDGEVDGVACQVVTAFAAAPNLGFDRVELSFAKDDNLLLESRYFRGDKEFRRLTSKRNDFRNIGGRRLAFHRIAKSWADDGETEIDLLRVLDTPELPDSLFSHMNLKTQRFPVF
jgi:hypothetical protein